MKYLRYLAIKHNRFRSLPLKKGDNSHQPLDDSDTRTNSAKLKLRISELEACEDNKT